MLDLPAAELRHIDAVLRLRHDLVRVFLAGEQESVGHADHREVLVALASAVARRCPTLFARTEVVPHVVGQNSVPDQHVALGGPAFVVDHEAAPVGPERAVVDERDSRARDHLAEAACVRGAVLQDVVSFEAVPASFVKKDPAAAALQDDGRRPMAPGARWSLVMALRAACSATSSTGCSSKTS